MIALKSALRQLRGGILLFVPLALSGCLAFNKDEAGTVGIIGGADGPTSIFFTSIAPGGLTKRTIALLIVIGFLVVWAAVILIRRHRNNKK